MVLTTQKRVYWGNQLFDAGDNGGPSPMLVRLAESISNYLCGQVSGATSSNPALPPDIEALFFSRLLDLPDLDFSDPDEMRAFSTVDDLDALLEAYYQCWEFDFVREGGRPMLPHNQVKIFFIAILLAEPDKIYERLNAMLGSPVSALSSGGNNLGALLLDPTTKRAFDSDYLPIPRSCFPLEPIAPCLEVVQTTRAKWATKRIEVVAQARAKNRARAEPQARMAMQMQMGKDMSMGYDAYGGYPGGYGGSGASQTTAANAGVMAARQQAQALQHAFATQDSVLGYQYVWEQPPGGGGNAGL